MRRVSFGGLEESKSCMLKGFHGSHFDRSKLHQEWIVDKNGVRKQVWKKPEEFFEVDFPGYNPELIQALKATGGASVFPGKDSNGNVIYQNGRIAKWMWRIEARVLPHVAKLIAQAYPDLSKDLLEHEKYAGHRIQHRIATESIYDSHLDAPKGDVEIPIGKEASDLGLDYFPFQKAGIEYIVKRDNTLLGDEMGLGKTLQAIGACNVWKPERVLIVVPATAKLGWKREWMRWNTTEGLDSPVIVQGRNKEIPDKGVVIINYDVLNHYKEQLDKVDWDVQLVDECHEIKTSQRGGKPVKKTVALVGKWDKDPNKIVAPIPAKKRIFMSGTPVENKPQDLFQLLRILDGEEGGLGRQYKRYVDEVGHLKNADELHKKLRSRVMVRRLADNVLDLPPLIHKTIVLEPDSKAEKALKDDREASSKYVEYIQQLEKLAEEYEVEASKLSEDDVEDEKALLKKYEAVSGVLKGKMKVNFEDIARIRHQTAVAKLPQFNEYMAEILDTEKKIIVFGHHKDVIAGIQKYLDSKGIKHVTVDGSTSPNKKQASIDAFQTDPTTRVFIGNIRAAGVSITLTEASQVLFAEQDWTPGKMDQASKRAHRIGQKNKVIVHNVVFDNTLDANMAHIIATKRSVARRMLDAGAPAKNALKEELAAIEAVAAIPKPPEPNERSVPEAASFAREFVTKIKEVKERRGWGKTPDLDMPEDPVEQRDTLNQIHRALRELSIKRVFGTWDSEFATSLALRSELTVSQAAYAWGFVNKYKEHLPEDMREALGLTLQRKKKVTVTVKKYLHIHDDPEKRSVQLHALGEAIHQLAALDSDRVKYRNDVGFNVGTSAAGHNLSYRNHEDWTNDEAERAFEIVRLHQSQLPDDLLDRAGIVQKDPRNKEKEQREYEDARGAAVVRHVSAKVEAAKAKKEGGEKKEKPEIKKPVTYILAEYDTTQPLVDIVKAGSGSYEMGSGDHRVKLEVYSKSLTNGGEALRVRVTHSKDNPKDFSLGENSKYDGVHRAYAEKLYKMGKFALDSGGAKPVVGKPPARKTRMPGAYTTHLGTTRKQVSIFDLDLDDTDEDLTKGRLVRRYSGRVVR